MATQGLPQVSGCGQVPGRVPGGGGGGGGSGPTHRRVPPPTHLLSLRGSRAQAAQETPGYSPHMSFSVGHFKMQPIPLRTEASGHQV